MLHCIYHVTGDIMVVDDAEKEKMLSQGAWFDHPLKAKAAFEKAEKALAEEKPKKKQKKEMENAKSS